MPLPAPRLSSKVPDTARKSAPVAAPPRSKARAPRGHEEEQLQRALLEYLAWTVPSVTPFSIPNSATRTRAGRAANFVPGLRPGVFDLGLILPPRSGEMNGLVAFVEVKAPGGKLSAEQAEFQTTLIRDRVPHCIARSIEDLREALRIWRVPTREIQPLAGARA